MKNFIPYLIIIATNYCFAQNATIIYEEDFEDSKYEDTILSFNGDFYPGNVTDENNTNKYLLLFETDVNFLVDYVDANISLPNLSSYDSIKVEYTLGMLFGSYDFGSFYNQTSLIENYSSTEIDVNGSYQIEGMFDTTATTLSSASIVSKVYSPNNSIRMLTLNTTRNYSNFTSNCFTNFIQDNVFKECICESSSNSAECKEQFDILQNGPQTVFTLDNIKVTGYKEVVTGVENTTSEAPSYTYYSIYGQEVQPTSYRGTAIRIDSNGKKQLIQL